MLLTRRTLGLGGIAAFASVLIGARGSSARRFLFVHAEGGWDPLCVFAPLFDAPDIEMEDFTAPLSVRGFSLVDSPNRPAVPAFFERWGARTLLLNGLSTRSVNHEVCQVVAMTGTTSDNASDWGTILAVADEASYFLPHLVLNGPAFPGGNTVVVSRAEGLVQQAVQGTILEQADFPVVLPSGSALGAVADYVDGRAASVAALHPELALATGYQAAVERARALTDAKELIDFPPVETLRDRGENAIRMLADGVCRCATISTTFLWDSHTNNADQTPLFESLFADLDALLETMAATRTATGGVLADETVVVVLSEMGRTPAFNSTQGRDHWPFTSALVIGPGITGGRTIGGYTDLYQGIGVDPASGEPDTARAGIDAKAFGATLLTLGGVDPAEHIKSPEVISGVLT